MFIVTQGSTTNLMSKLDDVLARLELSKDNILDLQRTGSCSFRDYTIQRMVVEPIWNHLELQMDKFFQPKQMWFRCRESNNAFTLAFGKFSQVLEAIEPPIKAMCLPGLWNEVLPYLQPSGHFAPDKHDLPPLPETAGDKIWRARFEGTCFGTIYSGIPRDKTTRRHNVIANKWTLDIRQQIWDHNMRSKVLYHCLEADRYSEFISSDLLDVLKSRIDPADLMSNGRWYLLPSGNISDVPS